MTEPSDQQILSNKKLSNQNTQLVQSSKQVALQSQPELELSKKRQSNVQESQKTQKKRLNTQSKVVEKSRTLQSRLFKNKYLKAIFTHFNSLSYINNTKMTFQQMAKQPQQMSLNKFIIFCKEFNLDQIIKYDDKKTKKNGSQIKNIMKNSQIKQSCKNMQELSKINNSTKKMMEIPVKEINKVQKKLNVLFKNCSQNKTMLNLDGFIKALLQIYQIYQSNYQNIHNDRQIKQIPQRKIIESQFIQNWLNIDSEISYKNKMGSLKIQFKNSLSYYNQASITNEKKKPTQSKKLVMHGGRYQQDVQQELNNFKIQKFQTKQNWLNSQSNMKSVYSKSRILYKPNPQINYSTNDVVRLARKQLIGKQNFNKSSLFDEQTIKQDLTLKKSRSLIKNKDSKQIVTFSRVFEDKTNSFSEKLNELKRHYMGKESKIKFKKLQQKQDDILDAHFANQKRIYGSTNPINKRINSISDYKKIQC